jgi:hypothetical protein
MYAHTDYLVRQLTMTLLALRTKCKNVTNFIYFTAIFWCIQLPQRWFLSNFVWNNRTESFFFNKFHIVLG